MNHEANISRADFFRKFPVMVFKRMGRLWEDEIISEEKSRNGARIPRVDINRCLAWGPMECQLCYLACPHRDKAIAMQEHKPVIIAAGCDGCAMCVDACKTINNTPALEMAPLFY